MFQFRSLLKPKLTSFRLGQKWTGDQNEVDRLSNLLDQNWTTCYNPLKYIIKFYSSLESQLDHHFFLSFQRLNWPAGELRSVCILYEDNVRIWNEMRLW